MNEQNEPLTTEQIIYGTNRGAVRQPPKRKIKKAKSGNNGKNGLLRHIIAAFFSAVFAGVLVSLSCLAYLSINNKNIGTVLFAFSFLVVFQYKFKLFQSAVLSAVHQKPYAVASLLPAFLGNFAGAALTALAVTYTRFGSKLITRAVKICKPKLADNLLSVFLLALLGGILMFVASDVYHRAENWGTRVVTLFATVMVVVYCGLSHVNLEMFYLTFAGQLSLKSLVYLAVVTAGNLVGMLLIPLFYWFYRNFLITEPVK